MRNMFKVGLFAARTFTSGAHCTLPHLFPVFLSPIPLLFPNALAQRNTVALDEINVPDATEPRLVVPPKRRPSSERVSADAGASTSSVVGSTSTTAATAATDGAEGELPVIKYYGVDLREACLAQARDVNYGGNPQVGPWGARG